MCRQLGTDQTTALWRAMSGEYAEWTFAHQLMAAQVNELRRLARIWGGAKSPYILPPDAEDEEKTISGTPMTTDEADDWLGW